MTSRTNARPACGRRAAVRFFVIFPTGWYGYVRSHGYKQRKSQCDVRVSIFHPNYISRESSILPAEVCGSLILHCLRWSVLCRILIRDTKPQAHCSCPYIKEANRKTNMREYSQWRIQMRFRGFAPVFYS